MQFCQVGDPASCPKKKDWIVDTVNDESLRVMIKGLVDSSIAIQSESVNFLIFCCDQGLIMESQKNREGEFV